VEKRGVSVAALIALVSLIGVAANSAGVLNSPSGGYLVCVDSKTKVITHPGSTSCPKGSKKLVLGAQGVAGTDGLTGAAGLSGKDGVDGKDGKTLWNGIKDPENTWGAPGDMFINSATNTLFGPKNLDGTWPIGVSMIGPKGAQGPIGLTGPQGPSGGSGPAGTNGSNATIAITELFECDGPDAGTVANEKCKIGMTGPGGGLIFFVDYNDQYAGFNYLEAAPSECEAQRSWSAYDSPVPAAAGWAARAVGAGSTNTTAILAALAASTLGAPAAAYADASTCGGKTDWFLGSLGEMKLIYDNLQGLGGFERGPYWSSTEWDKDTASIQEFNFGWQSQEGKELASTRVRPVRAF
jgi:hypothetical protein